MFSPWARRGAPLSILCLAVGLAAGCNSSTESVPLVCQLSPSPMDFGVVNVGDSTTLSLTITNPGVSRLSGRVSVHQSAEYQILGAADYSLDEGQSVAIPIRFRPSAAGHRTCVLDMGNRTCGHALTDSSEYGIQATGCGWAGVSCHSMGRLPR